MNENISENSCSQDGTENILLLVNAASNQNREEEVLVSVNINSMPFQQNNPRSSGATISVEGLVALMMEENRRRDQIMVGLMTVISRPNTENLYQIMPDFSKNISEFRGECDQGGARKWLHAINVTANLHC